MCVEAVTLLSHLLLKFHCPSNNFFVYFVTFIVDAMEFEGIIYSFLI